MSQLSGTPIFPYKMSPSIFETLEVEIFTFDDLIGGKIVLIFSFVLNCLVPLYFHLSLKTYHFSAPTFGLMSSIDVRMSALFSQQLNLLYEWILFEFFKIRMFIKKRQ